MVPNHLSTEPFDCRSPRTLKRKRNMKPCFACASKKTRCKLVGPDLCKKCQKEGRKECLPHVSWQDTVSSVPLPVQQAPVCDSSYTASSNPLEGSEMALPQANHQHAHYTYKEYPFQQSFLGTSAISTTSHYHNNSPPLDGYSRINPELRQRFYPSATLPGQFPANPIHGDIVGHDPAYTHHNIPPRVPSGVSRIAAPPQVAGPAFVPDLLPNAPSSSYSRTTECAINMDAQLCASGSGLGYVPNMAGFDAV